MKGIFTILLILSVALNASASGVVKPYKNELFNYPALLSTTHDGSFIEYDFEEMRDVNGRDEIPVQKAKSEYVEVSPATIPKDKTYFFRGGSITTSVIGSPTNAKFAVVFIHGASGSKELGVNDWTFGGNFNRLKNLALQNSGVYYSPTVSFDEQGIRGVSEIIRQIKIASPKISVVVACGSAGSFICWNLLHSTHIKLAGLIILGGAFAPDANALQAATKLKTPIVFAHGSNDRVLSWKQMYSAFDTLKSNSSFSKFILYRTGGHGTPIRMIDWRETLNWILEVSP